MKNFKRLTALVLAMLMLLVGCGSTANNGGQEGEDGMTTVTVMMWDRGHEYTNGNTVTNNLYTQWLNELMEPQGVHLEFIAVPRSSSDDQINMLLAGGEAPDIVRTYARQRVAAYAQQGGLVDFNNYLDKLDASYLRDAQDVLKYGQFEGGQYALIGLQEYWGKQHETYIRQDLVEGMGMELPTTKQELIDVLYAMKEHYPDITPWMFSGTIDNEHFNNWVLSYTTHTNLRDNYIYEGSWTMALKPGAKDGIRVLNQLWLDGIINEDFMLDTDMSKFEQAAANGEIGFIMEGSANGIDAYETVTDPNYHMIEIDCIEDLDGSYAVPSQDAFSHYIYVPKASEGKIDAIIKFLNLLGNEETALDCYYGKEGLGYEWKDGLPIGYSRAEKLEKGTHGQQQDVGGFMRTSFPIEKETILERYIVNHPDVPVDVCEGKVKSQYSNYYDKELVGAALPSDQYVSLVDNMIVELVYKCMAAPEGQFDAVYEAEYQRLLDNHLQEILDERAAWYDANIAK